LPIHNHLSKREFLKLSTIILPSVFLPGFRIKPSRLNLDTSSPSILVIVFDAFSAMNMTLYGYQHNTTPNIDRIAKHSIVYHNHFAGGHWTYPGTSSLLTGVYPWSHRGFGFNHPLVKSFLDKNLFGFFDDYYRITYTHNPIAENVILQLADGIEKYQPFQSLYINNNDWISSLFSSDFDIANISWIRTIMRSDDGYANSLLLTNIYEKSRLKTIKDYAYLYPRLPPKGLYDDYFLLEDAIDWIDEQVSEIPKPFVGYFHLFPPHRKYSPRREYFAAFRNDGYEPIVKPAHFLSHKLGQSMLNKNRRIYDEYILNVDAEFGRLIDSLERKGIMDNTWVILTSDHGEMFERGMLAHHQPVFYQPIARIPLIIMKPGERSSSTNIFSPTSATDLIPTLLRLTNKPIPDYLEGQILPPFRTTEIDPARSIYAVDASRNKWDEPITKGTIMHVKGQYKLIYYFGYKKLSNLGPLIELFDLENDPEELDNIAPIKPTIAAEMLDDIHAQLQEKDAPYQNDYGKRWSVLQFCQY